MTHKQGLFAKKKKMHFIGIGGIGMSGIAEILSREDYDIQGSDMAESEQSRHLLSLGIKVFKGHDAAHLGEAEVVVYSAAVPEDNPEYAAAKERGLPLISRAEMLGEMMRCRKGLAVSGTHGKTTTTSMLAEILRYAGQDPTFVIGGKLQSIDSNACKGAGDLFLVEACEAFASFLHFSPLAALILNIDADHMEYYGSMDALREAFRAFVGRVPYYGLILLNNDDDEVRRLIPGLNKPFVTFGIGKESDYMAGDIKLDRMSASFELRAQGKSLGEISMQIPGQHNVSNALGAAALALELGISFSDIQKALAVFRNADRRFQLKADVKGIQIYDDYAHHPAEVAATLRAAAAGRSRGRLIAVFQPHLYSRTRELYRDFAESLKLADRVYLVRIYPAREKPIPGVRSEMIADEMKKQGYEADVPVYTLDNIAEAVAGEVQTGDMVLFMGAGDIWKAAEELAAMLHEVQVVNDKTQNQGTG